jgi:diaminopimelate epimerase
LDLKFEKYSGTGNDFIVIDNRELKLDTQRKKVWAKICDRKNGVGADGILFVEPSLDYDFKMRYLNADGGEVDMCGNGARVLTQFVHNDLQLKEETNYIFETANGVYKSQMDSTFGVKLQMTELYDVDKIKISDFPDSFNCHNTLYLNTGVPHCIFHVDDVKNIDLQKHGAKVRYDDRFENGANANYFQVDADNKITMRTYERGVEGETLACGTGAVAAALACSKFFNWKDLVEVSMPGGLLTILFNDSHSEVFLCGQVEKIFSDSISGEEFFKPNE